MLFVVSISSVCLVCALVFMAFQMHKQSRALSVFEDILRVDGVGVLIFDHRNSLAYANVSVLEGFDVINHQEVMYKLDDFRLYF